MNDYTPQIPEDGELRTFMPPAFEVRDVDEKAGLLTRLAGRALAYGAVADIGRFTEEFTPRAFAKSIGEAAKGLPLTLFHKDNDLASLVGVNEEWHDRTEALDGVWRLDTSERAQEAGRLARDGYLNYMSIRFQPDRTRQETRNGKLHMIRQSARLIATSLVSTPAYAGSTVEWVRTHDADAHDAAAREELREWQTFLDDTLSARAITDENNLKNYWTKTPEGLAKWASHLHPWTELYHHLFKFLGPERAKRVASEWFHDVFGIWPGERKGKNPIGKG